MSRRRMVALALATAVLLSGCQDEPEPRFEDPTESPTPSESQSSDPPEKQSAEEFIREWVQLDAEMQNTGNTAEYLQVSSKCSSCRDFAQRVSTVYEAGGHIETDGWHVQSIRPVGGSRYRMVVNSSPTTVVEHKGADAKQFEGGRATYELAIRRRSQTWQVTDWAEVAM